MRKDRKPCSPGETVPRLRYARDGAMIEVMHCVGRRPGDFGPREEPLGDRL